MRARLLLLEDDVSLGQKIRQGLVSEGFTAVLHTTATDAAHALQKENWDAVILDWMLPDLCGVEFLRRIRSEGRTLPVLMLTARSDIEDRVEGLDAGADDYLVKPFAFAELLARIRSLMRRFAERTDRALATKDGKLAIDLMNRKVICNNQAVDLTPREYDLLAYLVAMNGEVVSRQTLVEKVWQAAGRFTSLDNVIDVHMANLRRKLRESVGSDPIETVRGVGYRLALR
jgi:two-component system copper resistance phosphate regulon response regulator CusR